MRNLNKYKFFLISTGSIFVINAFIYFFIKLFITEYNLIGSSLDNYIPFIPSFIYFYMMWYPFEIFSLYYIYKKDKNNYIKTLAVLIISLSIMYLIFIIYPTMVDRPEVNSFNSLTTLLLYIAFKSDTPVNCFPSGHCIICFVMIFSFIKSKNITFKNKIIFIVINILIILSTLFVKQHVIYDVIGSFILTITSFYLIYKTNLLKKIKLFN